MSATFTCRYSAINFDFINSIYTFLQIFAFLARKLIKRRFNSSNQTLRQNDFSKHEKVDVATPRAAQDWRRRRGRAHEQRQRRHRLRIDR